MDFIPPKYMAELMHGDKILARVKDTDERGRKDYAPVEILERAQKRIVGKLAVQQGVWSLLPDNRRLTHHLIIPADALGGARRGKSSLAKSPPTLRVFSSRLAKWLRYWARPWRQEWK